MPSHQTRATLLTLLAAIVAAAAAPIPAMAVTPSPSPSPSGSPASSTRPNIMRQAGDALAQPPRAASPAAPTHPAAPAIAVGGPGHLSREVFGFAQAGALGDSTAGYKSWDFSLLSTVAYFGVHVNAADGSLVRSSTDTGWTVWNSTTLANMVTAAHNAGARVVLTVVYQDTGAGMCTALQHWQTTVSQTVSEVQAKGVDGVNIDYEGAAAACGSSSNQALLAQFVQGMRNGLGANAHLTVDTYGASAAPGGDGFFNLGAMAPYVNAFFVMAYELDNSNWGAAPLNCSSLCLSPTSAYSAYRWNDQGIADQYTAAVGAGKTILGLPYYGWAACVTSATENAIATSPGHWVANTQLGIQGYPVGTQYTDSHDHVDHWYTYHGTGTDSHGQPYDCQRELYIDDAQTLGAKYQIVLDKGLAGAGIWSLDMGGGISSLWQAIASHFSYSCPVGAPAIGSTPGTRVQVTVTTNGCASVPSSLAVYLQDTTAGAPMLWAGSGAASGSGGTYTSTISIDTYAGHSYNVYARAFNSNGYPGVLSPAATMTAGSTQSHPFKGMYTLDGFGGVQMDDSAPVQQSGYWPGWDIAHAARAIPGTTSPQTGVVLDGFGGLHPYGTPAPTFNGGPYWPGWDIARDVQLMPDGSGGFVLDGFGGLHPFGVNGHAPPPAPTISGYWPNWDIARRFVLLSSGQGGYVMDGWGGLHPFSVGGASMPPNATGGPWWPNWVIARDVELIPNTNQGYVLDGFGGIHPFNGAPALSQQPGYWPGWDIARAIVMYQCAGLQPCGYLLDGFGGLHPFNAPSVGRYPYFPGSDLARDIWLG